MKILVLNSGSSSLRFQLVKSGKKFELIAKGHIDGIKLDSCKFTFSSKDKNIGQKTEIKSHEKALELALETLVKTGTIESYKDIEAIGHRVVHGGEKYSDPVKIDAKVIKEIEKLSELAPLHNPANLEGILACKKFLGRTKQVAVFDTAFHQTLPEKAYLYGLPYSWYREHGIRRYGFHGTSHHYVTQEALKLLKTKKAKIVSCHLGNGSSITASIDGISMDTSMGFTPLEGVMMGSRSGTIDPSIVFYAMDQMKLKKDKVEDILNHESGLKGFSEISSDMRKIRDKAAAKDERAMLTLELLSYQIAKYIGSSMVAINGIDALIFTGGIGENASYVREKVCAYLEFMGLKLNSKKNDKDEELISDTKSKVKVFVINTNEEKEIAIQTEKVLK